MGPDSRLSHFVTAMATAVATFVSFIIPFVKRLPMRTKVAELDLTSVCLCVCLSVCFPHDISKTDADRTTKLRTEMFHDESWKCIYFGVKRSKVKVTIHKKSISTQANTQANGGQIQLRDFCPHG